MQQPQSAPALSARQQPQLQSAPALGIVKPTVAHPLRTGVTPRPPRSRFSGSTVIAAAMERAAHISSVVLFRGRGRPRKEHAPLLSEELGFAPATASAGTGAGAASSSSSSSSVAASAAVAVRPTSVGYHLQGPMRRARGSGAGSAAARARNDAAGRPSVLTPAEAALRLRRFLRRSADGLAYLERVRTAATATSGAPAVSVSTAVSPSWRLLLVGQAMLRSLGAHGTLPPGLALPLLASTDNAEGRRLRITAASWVAQSAPIVLSTPRAYLENPSHHAMRHQQQQRRRAAASIDPPRPLPLLPPPSTLTMMIPRNPVMPFAAGLPAGRMPVPAAGWPPLLGHPTGQPTPQDLQAFQWYHQAMMALAPRPVAFTGAPPPAPLPPHVVATASAVGWRPRSEPMERLEPLVPAKVWADAPPGVVRPIPRRTLPPSGRPLLEERVPAGGAPLLTVTADAGPWLGPMVVEGEALSDDRERAAGPVTTPPPAASAALPLPPLPLDDWRAPVRLASAET